MANVLRPPIIQRRPPPELRYYGSQSDVEPVSPLASQPFVQRTDERNREYDKRDRAWLQGHVSQLLNDVPFLGSVLDRLRDRPTVSRDWIWESQAEELTLPFFGYSVDRLQDRPSVSRAWEWGVQEQEELTPPFFGIAFDRQRDEPQYPYGQFMWPAILPTITSTLLLQLPINAILHGQQQYKTRVPADDILPARVTHKTTVSGSQSTRIRGEAPSFTTKTGNRGYD